MDCAIRVRNVHKWFANHHVLSGVDLDVERGRINVIIGGSGQGKTLLLKHLIGLVRPDAGHIYIDGDDLAADLDEEELARVRRKLGMVFQHAALFDSLTVFDNVAFPLLERYRLPRDEVFQRVHTILGRLAVAEVARKFPAQLSGGQSKRVALARALVDRPQILLYDEPTGGLDPVATVRVDELILETSKQFGVTSVVVSHDMASIFRIGDRISLLADGHIVLSGPPAEVLCSPRRELREFIEPASLRLPC